MRAAERNVMNERRARSDAPYLRFGFHISNFGFLAAAPLLTLVGLFVARTAFARIESSTTPGPPKGLSLGAAGMLCFLAEYEMKAGETPREKAMNGDELPIRITLVSSTNTTAVASNNAARIHQGSLQWFIESSIEGNRFGRSLAVADINGDGFLDLFIGQPRGATTRNPGAIFVYYGAEAGIFSAAPAMIQGFRPRDMFGLAMADGHAFVHNLVP